MKKSRDSITIYHDDNLEDHYNQDNTVAASSSISNSFAETLTVAKEDLPLNHNSNKSNEDNSSPIKLNPTGAVQLTPSAITATNNDINSTNIKPANATTNAILSLKQNPFYHEKRRWDDSFTLAEKKELTGNIVKAARDMEGGNLITLQEEEYTVKNLSNEEDDGSQESDDLDSNKKPGRKPMADEEALSDSDQDPKVKRKVQNRAAQRAFRERKERYVKELEAKLKQVQDNHLVATSQLVRENHQLRSIIYRLEAENYALKGIPMQPYQHQTVLSPQSVLQQQQQQQRSSNNSNSNYPNIAPLLPNTPQQQPLLLPSYLSNSPPATSILHPANSPSVNHMMMLAQSRLHQYPMSPMVTMNHGNSLISSTSPTLSNTNSHKIAMPKKVSKKNNSHNHIPTPPPNNQPLEYTFSISTPASLRPSGGAVSSSAKHTRNEPVELVQLYPPSGNRSQHNTNDNNSNDNTTANESSSATVQKSDLIQLSSPNSTNQAKKTPSVASAASVGSPGSTTGHNNTTAAATPNSTGSGLNHQFADDNSSIMSDKTSSTVNTQQQRKKMQELTSDMFDCHIDTEGQIFCERLHNEVCNDAFDRLLSEPLFDQMGKLNLSISSYPVPIVTGRMSLSTLEEKPESNDSNDTSATTNEKDKPANSVAKEDNKELHKSNLNESSTTSTTKILTIDSPNTTANNTSLSTSTPSEKGLLTCPEIWFLLNQHEKFNNFTTDQYCQAVKELAKCSDSGPVLEEADLFQIMLKMDQGYL